MSIIFSWIWYAIWDCYTWQVPMFDSSGHLNSFRIYYFWVQIFDITNNMLHSDAVEAYIFVVN